MQTKHDVRKLLLQNKIKYSCCLQFLIADKRLCWAGIIGLRRPVFTRAGNQWLLRPKSTVAVAFCKYYKHDEVQEKDSCEKKDEPFEVAVVYVVWQPWRCTCIINNKTLNELFRNFNYIKVLQCLIELQSAGFEFFTTCIAVYQYLLMFFHLRNPSIL